MRRIIIRIAINAIALWVAAGLITGIELESGFWQLVLAAAIFGIVNALLKPLFIFLALPALLISLGMALIIVNALLLLITDYFTAALEVDGFWSAILGAAIISVVSWVAGQVFGDPKRSQHQARA